MNTGGPAFPQPNHLIETDRGREEARGWMADSGMTLLDWMAGQALAGMLACPLGSGCAEVNANFAYDYATAMLAEKARREADHSGDANKMVPDPFAETTLRRLAADVLPADIKDASNDQLPSWCAEQVRARVNTLESINRELVEALEKFLEAGVGFSTHPVVQHDAVVMARAALAKAKGIA